MNPETARHIRALARMQRVLLDDLRDAALTPEQAASIRLALDESVQIIAALTTGFGNTGTRAELGGDALSMLPWKNLLAETVEAHTRTRGLFGDVLKALGYASEMMRE